MKKGRGIGAHPTLLITRYSVGVGISACGTRKSHQVLRVKVQWAVNCDKCSKRNKTNLTDSLNLKTV
ncbi:unnamed protein product [Leptosia nina]|uniref:Uncharacterized protein n=1 Tax=Leptosia nina TaxID=320188 RepID=A0AAV1K6Z0_9NEOP